MKKAYTLLELILCLMIVAIITASAIVIVRPKDKTIRFLYADSEFMELDSRKRRIYSLVWITIAALLKVKKYEKKFAKSRSVSLE